MFSHALNIILINISLYVGILFYSFNVCTFFKNHHIKMDKEYKYVLYSKIQFTFLFTNGVNRVWFTDSPKVTRKQLLKNKQDQ